MCVFIRLLRLWNAKKRPRFQFEAEVRCGKSMAEHSTCARIYNSHAWLCFSAVNFGMCAAYENVAYSFATLMGTMAYSIFICGWVNTPRGCQQIICVFFFIWRDTANRVEAIEYKYNTPRSRLPPARIFQCFFYIYCFLLIFGIIAIRFCSQSLLNCLLMVLATAVICGVLIALQFPIVMSSPITALGFAALITGALGTVSTIVGQTLAPLPLFALILVSTYCVCCECVRISSRRKWAQVATATTIEKNR